MDEDYRETKLNLKHAQKHSLVDCELWNMYTNEHHVNLKTCYQIHTIIGGWSLLEQAREGGGEGGAKRERSGVNR